MPTAVLCADDDDDSVMEEMLPVATEEEQKPSTESSSLPHVPSTVTPRGNKKTTAKKASNANVNSTNGTSTTKKAATKKRPAASGSSSSTTTTKAGSKATNNTSKKPKTKGQMTLGSFFGIKTTPPPAAPMSKLSDERRAQLRDICLGRIVTPPAPTDTDRKVSQPNNNHHGDGEEDDTSNDPAHAAGTSSSSSDVLTPLAKDTTKPTSKISDDNSRNTGTATQGRVVSHHDDTKHNDDNDERVMDAEKVPVVDSPMRGVEKDADETVVKQDKDTDKDSVEQEEVTENVSESDAIMTDVPEKPNDKTSSSKLSLEDGAKNERSTSASNEPTDLELIDAKDEENTSESKGLTKEESIEEKTGDSGTKSCVNATEQTIVTTDEQTKPAEKEEKKKMEVVSEEKDSCGVESKSDSAQKKEPEQEEQTDAQLTKLQSLYDTYYSHAVTVFAACREGLVESVPALDRTFPEQVPAGVDESKARLAALIEGRSESLTALVANVAPQLVEKYFATVDEVTDEIKVLAKRQPLVKEHVPTVLEESSKPKAAPDIFEDESPDRFWQWNVTVVDLMPNKAAVKQRRAKIRKEVTYLHNLVSVLQTLKQLLASKQSERKSLTAKLSRQEEKVLQYQREQAKAVLEQQLKESQRLEKEKAKAAKKEAEAAKKKEAAAAKAAAKREAEAAKKEAEVAKKDAAALAKKEAKAKEAEEKAKQSEQEEQKKRAQLHRQQGAMMSFLQKAATTPKKKEEPVLKQPVDPVPMVMTKAPTDDFDVEHFRSQINSYNHDAVVTFGTPSESAIRSRRRRSRSVELSVYVTVESDNPFEARPYADLQKIAVRDRYKFLSFHEDVRPPYHGTWSKKSHAVNPRNPFKKDRKFFDYDYDSEAEWEEGDNEVGEDIENAADDEEEKDEEEADGDDDGWLAADDDLDDDPDEETKLLRQKLVRQEDQLERVQSLIAPVNGRPLTPSVKAEGYLEGISSDEAFEFLSSHTDVIVTDVELFLDPFPPLIDEDVEPSSPTEKKDTSFADMQAVLRFVHHNSVASKEKLIDELRAKLPDATSSRAQAMRTLESVAEKQKHPIKGHIWEIKKEVLEQYELGDLLSGTTENDPESAKKQLLRTLAGHIHNSTHTSKEKLVDDLQATHASILVSRAETLRHVDALAEKKKRSGGGVYWEVKSSAQRDLDLELQYADTPGAKAADQCDASNEDDNPSSAKKRKLSVEGDADTAFC
eukprot:scaffold482_cov266-Amphora_coffeaeformis.AAC.15